MIIHSMNASFGKLNNRSLKLKPGLNIIEAPNEAGKSTWSAFIRAMLYGINTAKRDTASSIADKTRYQPWNGGAMAGSMNLTARGKDVTIMREPLGKAPFKSFSAHYTGTDEEVPWLSPSNAGEALSGVNEEVFSRTAFIRQAGVRVEGDPALEKRISAIVSGGDENQSFIQTDAQLRAWQRERKSTRGGKIPVMEGYIRITGEKLQKLERLSDTMSEYRQELQRLEAREDTYVEDLQKYDILDEQHAKQRVLDAKRRASNDRDNYENAEKELIRDGEVISRDDLDELKSELARISERYKMVTEATEAKSRTAVEAAEAKARLERSPFNGKDQQEVGAIAATMQELERAAEDPPMAKRPVWQTALNIAMLVLGVLGAAAGIVLAPQFGWPAAILAAVLCVCGLMIAAGIVLICKKPGPSQIEGKRLHEYLALYGFDNVEAFANEISTYGAACQRQQALTAATELAAANEEAASKALQEAQMGAAEKARRLMPHVQSAAEIREGIAALDEGLNRLGRLRLNMVSSQNAYEALRDEQGGDTEEDIQFITPPMRSREDTEAALDRCRRQLKETREKLNITQGEQRAMGDPLLLASERERYEDELAILNEQYEALTIALDALKAADAELQTRFSPLISDVAGRYMSRLTGGRYEDIVFSKDFSALVKAGDDPVSHSVLSVSDGTRDQAYLSLRLALVELMLSGDEKCPIILDDALTNFDDGRAALALDLLRELSEYRQVILFTCHSREAAHFENDPRVNIVREL